MVGYNMEMENLCIFKLVAGVRCCWGSPGHSWPLRTSDLIWWRHRVWVAPGQGGPLGNYLSSLYCQIIDSIREIAGPHRPATWAGQGTSRVICDFWAEIFLFLQSRSHVPCVLRTIVSRVSHEARGQKHTLESGAGALWQGRSLSNEQPEGWEGSALSTCHNLNSNLAMKSLKWIRVIFNSYQQSCHLPLSN